MTSNDAVVVTFDDTDKILLAKWTIKEFSSITNVIESPKFSHVSSNIKWGLKLFPKKVKNGKKYVRVKISSGLPVQVKVKFDMRFESKVSPFVMSPYRVLKQRFITNWSATAKSLLMVQDVSKCLKPNGSLVFAVWIDYSTIMVDQTWTDDRMKMSEDFKMLLNGKYTDITFFIGYQSIKAHKVIVSRCKYFEAMLDGDNIESRGGVITISDFKFAIVRGMLEFIYCGWIKLTQVSFAVELRMAADKYDLPGLVKLCDEFIVKNVAPKNVSKAILSTTLVESMAIKEACLKVIRANPKDIVDYGKIFDNESLRVYVLSGTR